MITFTKEQQGALDAIDRWRADPTRKAWFYLAGFAGSGKTELAKTFNAGGFEWGRDYVNNTQFCAFTGKAASVMRKKGCHGATTIHSQIYKPDEDETGRVTFMFHEKSPISKSSLIVLDECSMVDEELAHDLLWYGVPILVIGDPAQLPPIGGYGYFTEGKPDYMLTEIHRQAADNPIIQASMRIRFGEPFESSGDEFIVTRATSITDDDMMEADQILCGTNSQRRWINRTMRKLHGKDNVVEMGDKLVCLRNNRELGCFNGTTWLVVERPWSQDNSGVIMWNLTLKSMDEEKVIYVQVPENWFRGTEEKLSPYFKRKFAQFTYGYGLTVHKAQGSQWNNVLLFDESRKFQDSAKEWLYTGVTRAAERIKVVK